MHMGVNRVQVQSHIETLLCPHAHGGEPSTTLARIIHLTFIPGGIEVISGAKGELGGGPVWREAQGPLSPNVCGTLKHAIQDCRELYDVSGTRRAQAS